MDKLDVYYREAARISEKIDQKQESIEDLEVQIEDALNDPYMEEDVRWEIVNSCNEHVEILSEQVTELYREFRELKERL